MTWDDFFKDVDRRRTKGVDVLPYPHPALRYPAVPVLRFGPELRAAIRLMFCIMYERRGVGLAAPQIGLPLQFFVLNHTVKQKEGSHETDYDPKKEMVFINPTVAVKESRGRPPKMVPEMEGCLSILGLNRVVVRANTVTFKAKRSDGEDFKGEFNGLVARILQHEYDHLHGRLFVDALDEEQKSGVSGWLNYECGHFEQSQKYGTFKSIEEEKAILKELEKLA